MTVEITAVRKRYERIKKELKYAETERASMYIEALGLVFEAWFEIVLIDTAECTIIEEALIKLMDTYDTDIKGENQNDAQLT